MGSRKFQTGLDGQLIAVNNAVFAIAKEPVSVQCCILQNAQAEVLVEVPDGVLQCLGRLQLGCEVRLLLQRCVAKETQASLVLGKCMLCTVCC